MNSGELPIRIPKTFIRFRSPEYFVYYSLYNVVELNLNTDLFFQRYGSYHPRPPTPLPKVKTSSILQVKQK